MAYFLSLGGLGMIYLFKGDSQKNFELGRILLEFGESHSDLRSTVVGYICTSYGHYSAGDFSKAVEWSKKAVELSNDPIIFRVAQAGPRQFLYPNRTISGSG